ncbi:DUF1810 family protein [Thioclava sp. GXIMD4216]|uniref:DUF1810 family protein n=1 Tax=Thioclava litoralis TaxID=3076557 RepID=A0ABZ1DZH1_9RHOB|nr:DUF1810 family protein [Thioclava sp. FTW29]
MAGLERFLKEQERDFPVALSELQAGRKRGHWMWWIFPQLASLGISPRSKEFGLADMSEARAYLDNQTLQTRLSAACKAVLQHPEKDIDDILGTVDARKLRSCMTLFEMAETDAKSDSGAIFTRVLVTFYNGSRCPRTLEQL